jgi:hypothetical protein
MRVRPHAKWLYLSSILAAVLLAIFSLTNGGLPRPSRVSMGNALQGFGYFSAFNAIGLVLSILRRNLTYLVATVNLTGVFLCLMFAGGWALMTLFIASGGDKGGGGPFEPLFFLKFNLSWSLSQLAIFVLICTYLGAGKRLGLQ